MLVLIAGCGYLGREIGRQLRRQGHQPIALCRSAESAVELAAENWHTVLGDLSDNASMTAAAAQVKHFGPVDAVIHCAASRGGGAEAYEALYRRGMQNLTRSFPATRMIFTSSTSVYPQIDGSWVTEQSPANPSRETGRILRETEEITLQAGGAVLRLAGLYGPGRSVLLKNFLEGKAVIDVRTETPPTPDGRWINQIHRDDAAAAAVHFAVNGGTGCFNVCDVRPMTQREVYRLLCEKFPAVPMPPDAPPDPSRKRGWTNKRVSSERLRRAGWQPRYPDFFAALPELLPTSATDKC